MQSNTQTGFIVGGVVLVVAIIGFVIIALSGNTTAVNLNNATSSSSTTSITNSNAPSSQSGTREISLSEIATHSNSSSCWMAIDGKVYDVTSFINTHPGGAQILQGCGKDASSMFAAQGHSSAARQTMQQFYIGDLQ